MGRFKTHEERAARKIQKLEQARNDRLAAAQKAAANQVPSFSKFAKKVVTTVLGKSK